MTQHRKPRPSDDGSGTKRGAALLNDPALNKGTAFTAEKREKHGLVGLLPDTVETLDRQVERVQFHLDARDSDLERYICQRNILGIKVTTAARIAEHIFDRGRGHGRPS